MAERFCKDCGLAIEGQDLYCEFCLERRSRESAKRYKERGKEVAAEKHKSDGTLSGWRGRPCGGGRGVSLETYDFFGDDYSVAVAVDPAARVERSTLGEDMAAGNPGDDMAEGEPCSS